VLDDWFAPSGLEVPVSPPALIWELSKGVPNPLRVGMWKLPVNSPATSPRLATERAMVAVTNIFVEIALILLPPAFSFQSNPGRAKRK
jgi:hypothetical protein